MNDDFELNELIDHHLRGELTEAEKERLAERLDSYASARRDFVEHAQWDTRIAEVLREIQAGRGLLSTSNAEAVEDDMVRTATPGHCVLAAVAVAAMLLCTPVGMRAAEFKAKGNTHPTHRAAPYARGEVVVTFDTMPAEVSFDLPCFVCQVTENGIRFTCGATETYIDGFEEGESYEVWNDKENVYSRFWIESQNDARIVVRHRNALVRGGKIAHARQRKVSPYGPGEWTDEWFVFHPDGTYIHRVRVYTPNAEKSTTCPVGLRPDQFLNKAGGLPEYSRHELEGMYLVGRGPGIVVEDELEKKVITLIKMDDSYRDVSFDPYPITKYGEPGDAKYTEQWKAYGDFRHSNIHVINTKSKWRPFRICRPDKWVERGWPGHHNLLVTPYMPVHKLTHLIPCFPAGSDRKTGYFLAGLGQMTCAEHWQVTKDSISEIWLNGCTDSREPAKELAALARSWQNAPKMSLIADNGAEVLGYSIGERAYLADALKVKGSKSVAVELAASEDSPAVNPAFLINKWGKAKPRLKVDGKIMRPGTDFRFGYYKTLGTEDGRVWKDALIMWVKLHSAKPVQIAF